MITRELLDKKHILRLMARIEASILAIIANLHAEILNMLVTIDGGSA